MQFASTSPPLIPPVAMRPVVEMLAMIATAANSNRYAVRRSRFAPVDVARSFADTLWIGKRDFLWRLVSVAPFA